MARPDAYRLFHVHVKQRQVLSPSLVRFVLTGTDVDRMAMLGPDQRIKVFFPLPGEQAPSPPAGEGWYARYRALPEDQRPPMRTYTISALRAADGEVDVDFVLHGETGPASRWALHAKEGDRIALLAPDRASSPDAGGHEWHPPASARRLLVVADETALPAALGIVRTLAAHPDAPRAHVLIEIPQQADVQSLHVPPHIRLQWLPRDGSHHGQRLLCAVETAYPSASRPPRNEEEALPDIDHEILWQLADADGGDFYAWIAGEAGVVMSIRRHLVNQVGLDRHQITFMGYWRQGRTLD